MPTSSPALYSHHPSSSSSSSSNSTTTFASAAASFPPPESTVASPIHPPRPSTNSSASSSLSTPTVSAAVSVSEPPSTTTTATTDNTTTPTNTTSTAANNSTEYNRDITSTPNSFSGSVVGSVSRRNRRSLAAFAREKTSSALASLSAIGDRSSAPATGLAHKHHHKPSQLSAASEAPSPLTPPLSDGNSSSEHLATADFPANSCAPASHVASADLSAEPAPQQKMHQTSSRLLRMTEDDRPFTKVRLTKITGMSEN